MFVERSQIGGKNHIVGYHTQEYRYEDALTEPKICSRTDAWLGIGSYFWVDLMFAKYWGEDSKVQHSPTGCYDIYKADIDEELLLNTVFNEEHYNFFVETINNAIQTLKKKGASHHLTLKNVNRYLVDTVWKKTDITGIIFEDIPNNPKYGGRTYSEIPPLYYLKRIQIVAYNSKIIRNFELHLEEQSLK